MRENIRYRPKTNKEIREQYDKINKKGENVCANKNTIRAI